ncbi:TadE/TadG family type IV pilus assembly protein [Pollutimonas sp. M17]|uniref:TadE/TadG family type IV pilus assembly protein n=1 Tax=Pollutimonas sp. M17 TaxID=2962065 RepID=UPI0021F40AAE|nr:TadE/TadG family type IV pilus assembly protein [Pollutimonas sp. M17]UYO94840.1 hypothetical protein OEG81_05875 [Pollutimonas sp. M17]
MSPKRALLPAHGDGQPRQSGASLIEFSAVALPILLLGLGSVDIAAWLFARQAASLALLEAGRAGIVGHAHPDVMIQAFEQALLPMFPGPSRQASRQKLQNALHRRTALTGRAPWQIEVLSPTPEAFRDFADATASAPGKGALAAINNDYQHEQNQKRREQGWAGGLGPASGASIFQANTLVLRLSYLHEPVLPGIKRLIRLLGQENGSYRQHALAHGYLPLVREMALGMQSHPVEWPLPAGGKIVRGPSTAPGPSSAWPGCIGSQCGVPESPASHADSSPPNPAPAPPDPGGTAQAGDPTPWPAATDPPPGSEHLAVSPDDPACGVVLCCAPA